MGKTYKHTYPDNMHRNPRGRKQALIEKSKHGKTRNKSIPPDAWDDLPYDNQIYLPHHAANHMVDQGLEADEIIKKLQQKFKLSHKLAKEIAETSLC